MPTHKDDDSGHGIWQEPEDHSSEPIDASAGFEKTDVKVTGIVVFLASLGIFVVVTAVLCYGIGMVINAHLKQEYGPTNKWSKSVDVSTLGSLASNPELQNKMAAMTQNFPTPRLQLDDGYQEIADQHEKEDLLLEHYTWANQAQGKVRIPIERAMELIAQNGLPVAPAVVEEPLMTGETKPVVTMPLTNGFARTGYEHDLAVADSVENKRAEAEK